MTLSEHNAAPTLPESTAAPNSRTTVALSFCNIAHHLPRMATQVPDQKAVVITARRDKSGKAIYESLSFAQMEALSNRYASGLAAHGFTRGQRVLMMVRPGFDFIAITFALFKLGAVPVLIDPGMGIARMLDCIRSVDVQGFIGIPLAQLMRVLRPGSFGKVTHCVTVGRRFGWSGPTLKEIGERGSDHFDLVDTRADEIAAILFTSGSTGPAKGVVYEHGMFDAQVRMIQSHYGIMPGEVDLPALPIFALFSTAMGMTCVIPDMDPSRPARVNPAHIVEAIVDQHVTNTFGSPAIWKRVVPYCQQHGIKLTFLMRVLVAGCAVPPKLIAQLRELLTEDADVHTPYGATEALPICSISGRELLRAESYVPHGRPGTALVQSTRSQMKSRSDSSDSDDEMSEVGREELGRPRSLADASKIGYGICVGTPLPGIEMRIIRITDDPIPFWYDELTTPDGEYGEVVVSGKNVTRTYLNRPEADAISKIEEGSRIWHRMGDIGYRDANGRLWFCGRKSHRIQGPTATLFPDQWEVMFNEHPRVIQTALVGIGPPRKQKAIVIVVPSSGRKPRFGAESGAFQGDFFPRAPLFTVPHWGGVFQFLYRKSLPVDVRHNAKINREALAVWAAKQLGG